MGAILFTETSQRTAIFIVTAVETSNIKALNIVYDVNKFKIYEYTVAYCYSKARQSDWEL
jgi:hypothetical protein